MSAVFSTLIAAGEYLGMSPVAFVLALVVLGLMMLGAEIFVLPGFGVAGILGILSLLGGATVAWIEWGAIHGIAIVFGTITAAVVLTVVAFRAKSVRRRFVLESHLEKGDGKRSEDLSELRGKTGQAHTDLRPAGIADIDGRRVDVVSEGGFIEKGEEIRVLDIDGPRVIVARTSKQR